MTGFVRCIGTDSGKRNVQKMTETFIYRGATMEEEYWEKFRATGSVKDYLSYRASAEQRNNEEQKVQGESYGREHYGDRNDFVGTTE